jgi:hypothetical protein
VAELPADADHLGDELHVEALLAGMAHGAAGGLAAHGLLVALVRAEEGEAAVSLFHLVAELHVETLRADAATLGHGSHRVLVGAMGEEDGPRKRRAAVH